MTQTKTSADRGSTPLESTTLNGENMTEYERFINSDEYERWRMADKLHFYPEHLFTYYREGTPEENLEFFRELQKEFPSMQYSTSVLSKRKLENGLETWLIRRFISVELNQLYCTWPPQYVRNGGKIL